MEVQSIYFNELAKVFTPTLFDSLVRKDNKKLKLFAKNILKSGLINENKNYTFSKVFEILYRSLNENYRCEYLYKNSIAQQLLLKKN